MAQSICLAISPTRCESGVMYGFEGRRAVSSCQPANQQFRQLQILLFVNVDSAVCIHGSKVKWRSIESVLSKEICRTRPPDRTGWTECSREILAPHQVTLVTQKPSSDLLIIRDYRPVRIYATIRNNRNLETTLTTLENFPMLENICAANQRAVGHDLANRIRFHSPGSQHIQHISSHVHQLRGIAG